MAREVAAVSNRTHNGQSLAHATLNGLRQRIGEIAFVEVAARRDINDANLVLFVMGQNPFEPALNLIFSDATGAANLYQHEISFRSDAAIKAAGQSAIAGGDHRSHHSMPARDIIGFQQSLVN